MGDFPIAAVLLARDSAATIERAIASVLPIAQQIVVLDTGSQDDTPSRCLRLGAEVYFARWEEDSAAARNEALRYVRMPWVLMLDSDEELDEPSFRAHAEVLAQVEDLGGIELLIRSVPGPEQRTPWIQSHRAVRLFRYAEGIRYRGRVHEQIRPALEERGWRILPLDICIWHYGYSGELVRQKGQRNAELLRAELQHAPEDAWLQYQLGLAEFAAGNAEAAYALLSRVLGHPQLSPEQQLWARLRLAQAALSLGRVEEVLQVLQSPFAEAELEGMRLFVRAAALLQQNRFQEALQALSHPLLEQCPYIDYQQLQHFRQQLERYCSA